MKMNCQLMNTEELAKVAANIVSKEIHKGVTYKSDSCYLTKDGKFHFVFMDNTGTFGARRTFTANELAYEIDMPLWEIVGIDNGGFDDLAILFYEEN